MRDNFVWELDWSHAEVSVREGLLGSEDRGIASQLLRDRPSDGAARAEKICAGGCVQVDVDF